MELKLGNHVDFGMHKIIFNVLKKLQICFVLKMQSSAFMSNTCEVNDRHKIQNPRTFFTIDSLSVQTQDVFACHTFEEKHYYGPLHFTETVSWLYL